MLVKAATCLCELKCIWLPGIKTPAAEQTVVAPDCGKYISGLFVS